MTIFDDIFEIYELFFCRRSIRNALTLPIFGIFPRDFFKTNSVRTETLENRVYVVSRPHLGVYGKDFDPPAKKEGFLEGGDGRSRT